ncbi:ribonuclease P protein component [Brevibacterium samyangense]|uniref:Ribonuclease P protein component n=1 Tax=Brevibacterium samyangense TaxID=366888 RepID=A0ABP5EJ21_9MICO
MLPGRNRIRHPEDFRRVFRTGRKVGSRELVLHHLRTNDESHAPGVGFVVSKAVGNAVVRNRVKRRLREILHARLDCLEPAERIVVRALPAAAGASFAELEKVVDRSLRIARDPAKKPARARR